MKLDLQAILNLQNARTRIRNMSVIAHVDHGKTTLSDSLVGAAGIIAEARVGDVRYCQAREDEQERGITIKSTAVSMFYSLPNLDLTLSEHERAVNKQREEVLAARLVALEEEKKAAAQAEAEESGADASASAAAVEEVAAEDNKEAPVESGDNKESEAEMAALMAQQSTYTISEKDFLINLIDSPGHVDFSSEVSAALRVTDGALVVVDCVEGVCVQTETVLRQAIAERIKPVLFVNKIDRCITELQLESEDAYQSFNKAIESANVVIETYNDQYLGDVQVSPFDGTVGFGSALMGWGFTLDTFARIYQEKFGLDREKMVKRMWGDNFFDPKTSKWSNRPVSADGKALVRGFCHYIWKPITTMFEAVLNGDKDKYTALVDKLGIKVPADAKDLQGKHLLKRLMQSWIPSHETLLSMIVVHLPSPVDASRYRVENLYNGPQTDRCAKAIRECDPNGPLMLFVSKMVPTSDKGRFYAFGRVFSGTARTNQTVRIMGPQYKAGSKVDLYVKKKIQRTVLMMGRYVEQIPLCPCGNVVGLVGIDQFLLKAGTITDSEDAHPFHCMRFSVSPVVRVAVEVKNNGDLPKLVEGLRRLAKSDPLVQCTTLSTGEHIIAGAGELHLEICLKDLTEDFMKGAPIKVSEPVVAFCETVTIPSEMQCVSKSGNKHNRLYCVAEPLADELCAKIESQEIDPDSKDIKKRAKILVDEFGWQKTDALKIWCFGCPPDGRNNILVDVTKGAAFLNEIKDSMTSAFAQMTSGGVFCDEPWRGIRINLQDVVLHTDSIHRGAGQIQPCAKKVYSACQIKSGPRLMEPMYLCDITVPQQNASGVFSTLQTRRGRVCPDSGEQAGGSLIHIKAFLPVLESFGFSTKLRQNTSGKAFPQMFFDHWEQLGGDPYDTDTKAYEIVMAVRKRKGLKEELPQFGDYYDKIN